MNAGLILLIVALSAGLTSGYTTRVLVRGPEGLEILYTRSWFRSVVGALAFVGILAALIWGLMNLTWWWVVLTFFGVSLLIVPLLFGGSERLPLMLAIQPALDVVCVGVVAYLWVAM